MKMKRHTNRPGPARRKFMGLSSILVRTAMLSWLVSIVSISIFVFHVIPQQKQIFLDVLESKARVLASSIHDVAASAIVTEEYGEVVDHCMEIIMENPSVSYLVLTRQDGFSLVHKADGWNIGNMKGIWSNGFGEHAAAGAIRNCGLVDHDTYHYVSSFDFSGIHWGLAHIGLSLDQYHAGVTTVYRHTAYVALLCALVGLIISLLYASRLVKPILKLEGAVRNVAEGDLNARANIQSGDEVEDLAHAFNKMTQSIQDREALVRAQNQQLTALVTEKALHDGNLVESAMRICEASTDTLDVEEAGIWLFNEDQTVMECLTFFNRSNHSHSQGVPLSRKGHEPYFEALETTRVLAISDAFNDPATACIVNARMRSKTGAVLDSPIRIGGLVVGVICQQNTKGPRLWTVEEENFAGSLSDLMALALEARDRRASQDELVEAKEAAEAASEAKSLFLANMNHEIRTPLNGVVGMLKLLRESPLNSKQQRFVNKGILSSEALLVVINDILDFSKIEAGKMEIENLPFNLIDITENVTQMFAQRAEEKGLELVSFIHNDVPAIVCGDANRLGQVLINLVSNSIKFTERGDVIIRVRLESRGEEQCAVRFEIKDTGIGISLEEKERIFEAFLQEDSSTTRRFGGTGLGLGISRQLVELMGGKIQVESRPGYGSTFWFTINLGISTDIYQVPNRCNSMRGLQALVVDDHSINREILRYELDTWGCRTEEAANGALALEIMRERATEGKPFDFAVVDWNMPGINGEELGRRIQADPLLEKTTLIMLSSVNDMNSSRLKDAGFSSYLSKPARQSEMYDAIINSINNVPETSTPKEQPVSVPDADCADIRILVAEDNEINQEVAIEILKASGYSCDVVNNGRKAVEAVESGEFDLLFMDCMMPEMDGYEATRRIRKRENGGDWRLPIVALTANAMKGDREKCLESGMDDYLSKPLDPAETVAMIKKWHTPSAVSEKAAFTPENKPGAVLFDREKLLNRCMGNDALVEKLITKFLGQLNDDLQMLGDGLSDNNAEEVVHAAHRIKGASANLSMESLRGILAEIENCARSQDIKGAAEGFHILNTEVLRVREHFDSKAFAGQNA